MNGVKKSAYFQKDILDWLLAVSKKEGFNLSQTINWVLRKAKEAEDHHNV